MNVMPLSSYKEIIRHCFSQDQDLIEKWHLKAGEGLSKCVDQTYEDMREAGVEFFVVFEEKDLVGYFGKETCDSGEFLTGFFVVPKFRNKTDLAKFWKIVKSKFGSTFFCGLFKKNQPAIDFITKNKGEPMIVVKKHGEVGLIYRIKEQSCQ